MRNRYLYALLLSGVLAAAVGCGPPNVSGSTAPLSDEEKRMIAEQDKKTDEEESPGNRNFKKKK